VGKNSYPHHPYDPLDEGDDWTYKSRENSIRSINIQKSFENNLIEYNWVRNIDTGNEYDTKMTFVISDIIIEDNDDIVFAAVSHQDSLYCIDKSNNMYYSSSIGLGRLSPEGDVKNWKINNGLNVSLWGGSDKGNLEITRNPGKIYYSETKFPKLMSSPDGKGYIMAHVGEFDELTYPKGHLSSQNSIATSPQLYIYLSKKTLDPISFDLLSIESNHSYQTDFWSYNSSSKSYRLIKSKPKSIYYTSEYIDVDSWKFQPKFNKSWLRKPKVREYKGEDNSYSDYMNKDDVSYQTASDDINTDDASSNTSSSNSQVSKPKYVTIYNKTGRDIYYVEESSSNPTRINANSSEKVDCSEDYWYTFDANDGINGGNSDHPKLYNANSDCGNSVTIK